jgi:hypothetical protein
MLPLDVIMCQGSLSDLLIEVAYFVKKYKKVCINKSS